jgi:hypothetical protein
VCGREEDNGCEGERGKRGNEREKLKMSEGNGL